MTLRTPHGSLVSRAAVLLSAIVLCGAARAADETTPPPAAEAVGAAPVAAVEIPKVTIRFEKTEIADVAMQLHEKTGFDFVVGRGVQGQVTASFTDQPLDKMLTTICTVLGLTVDRHERMFVIKTKQAPEALAGPLTGAGALLPGEAPVAPLREAGGEAAQLGGAATAPAETRAPRIVTEQIPLNAASPQAMATMFGAPWIDSRGVAHTPQEAMYNQWLQQQWQAQQQNSRPPAWATPGWSNQAWPNGNLPEGSVVSRDGTILLPNGTIINRNGQMLLPNGTIVNPNGYVPYANQRPTAHGNIAGVPFAVGPNGGVTVAPGGVNLGGLGTLYLPNMTFGGSNQGNGQTYQPQYNTNGQNQTGGLDPWINNLGPSVHIGKPPVGSNAGLVAPGWQYAPPRGMENVKPGVIGAVGTPVLGVADGLKKPKANDEVRQP